MSSKREKEREVISNVGMEALIIIIKEKIDLG
jgi:hypothetical protein